MKKHPAIVIFINNPGLLYTKIGQQFRIHLHMVGAQFQTIVKNWVEFGALECEDIWIMDEKESKYVKFVPTQYIPPTYYQAGQYTEPEHMIYESPGGKYTILAYA